MCASTTEAVRNGAAMRRVALASLAGTTIEFYDFFIFGTATALVFGSVFFAELGGGRGTLALGATYAVAFVARPVGSVLFGHIGDRLGRKKTLILTLLLMGGSTFAIGLIPSYAAIGVTAPLLLVALRFVQGLAVGGEWAGASLLTTEYAPPGHRGRYGTFPAIGPGIAFGLSAATFLLIFSLTGNPTTNSDFQSWGWRIPFLASSVLIGIGLYVRLKIEETPIFREALASARPLRVPVRNAVAAQWRQILLAAGATSALFAFFYIGVVFVTGYAGRNPNGVPPGVLGFSAETILTVQIFGAVVYVVLLGLSAAISDRVGRRAVILSANLAGVPIGLTVFPLMNGGGKGAFALATFLLIAMVALTFGPVAAYFPEIFDTGYRYTAVGLAYNLALMIGGGIPIILAPEILDAWGSEALGYALAGLAISGAVCTCALPETGGATLEIARPDEQSGLPDRRIGTPA